MTPPEAVDADEGTPLFVGSGGSTREEESGASSWWSLLRRKIQLPAHHSPPPTTPQDGDDRRRVALCLFLEARTPTGLIYEKFTIFLILLSVVTFVLSSVYIPEYNVDSPYASRCNSWCDAVWFGNNPDNALGFLGIGSTSIVEIFVVFVFSVDYALRFHVADLDDARYAGVKGRLVNYVPSFFSLVDLASTVPFYVDSFVLPNTDLAASNFLRMFRLLRMMKVEGRYDMAMGMIDDVLYAQRGILGTALFVGVTVWGVVSAFSFCLVEITPRRRVCGVLPLECATDHCPLVHLRRLGGIASVPLVNVEVPGGSFVWGLCLGDDVCLLVPLWTGSGVASRPCSMSLTLGAF